MKWFVSISVLLFICGFAFAEKTLLYREYNEKTGEITRISRYMGDPTSGKIKITINWEVENSAKSGTQTSTLNARYATLHWKVIDPNEHTDYVGERKGNLLLIKGTHKDKPVDKRMKIDDLPFFSNPTIGLEEFVRTGKKKMDFRIIRPDDLSQYKMKAENKGEQIITVGDKPIEVIQVKWGLTGLRSKFYSQTYWFRKSDGVFVRSKISYDRFSELVKERVKP
jgi:hypothetical protein